MNAVHPKKTKSLARERRHRRVRRAVSGTEARPRLSVFRSNRGVYAQLVNDAAGATLAAASELSLAKTGKKLSGTKQERARQVGMALAAAAKEKKISAVVFDRGGYLYAGRVKALADGAREGGLSL